MSISRDIEAITQAQHAEKTKIYNAAWERQDAETKEYLKKKNFEDKRLEDLLLLVELTHVLFVKFLRIILEEKLARLEREINDLLTKPNEKNAEKISRLTEEQHRVQAEISTLAALQEKLRIEKEKMASALLNATDKFNKIKDEAKNIAENALKDFTKMSAPEFKVYAEKTIGEIDKKMEANSAKIDKLNATITDQETILMGAQNRLEELDKRLIAIKNELLTADDDATKKLKDEKESILAEKGNLEKALAKLSAMKVERDSLKSANDKLADDKQKLIDFAANTTLQNYLQQSFADKLKDGMQPFVSPIPPGTEGTADTVAYCKAREGGKSESSAADQVAATRSASAGFRMDLIFEQALREVSKEAEQAAGARFIQDDDRDAYAAAQAQRIDDFNAEIQRAHAQYDEARIEYAEARREIIKIYEPVIARLEQRIGIPGLAGQIADGVRLAEAARQLEQKQAPNVDAIPKAEPPMAAPPPVDINPQAAAPADAAPLKSYDEAVADPETQAPTDSTPPPSFEDSQLAQPPKSYEEAVAEAETQAPTDTTSPTSYQDSQSAEPPPYSAEPPYSKVIANNVDVEAPAAEQQADQEPSGPPGGPSIH